MSLEVLTGESKIVVEEAGDRYVFQRTEHGLEYDWEASEVSSLKPSSAVLEAAADAVDVSEPDVFPILVEMSAVDDGNPRERAGILDLPRHDDDLLDVLRYYPGEIRITYQLDYEGRSTHSTEPAYSLKPVKIETNGTTFTPENDAE
ncbi:hypothetical protein [Salinibaculum rarum]|uniref:hypothetical protein n=1 Tax=Salinibaculum rarum TaxID=3058903 RepID=UPI002660594C|nr:hypothetical protein [Salinibaculum sp. KK48]